MGGIRLGQKNQIYAKWIRILPSPDDPNEFYLVIVKDKPMSKETMKDFDIRFSGEDIILTITKLIRKKKQRNKTKR